MVHEDVDLPPERKTALDAVSLISRKWQPTVLAVLAHRGPMRFSALLEAIPEISGKVLTDTLDALEETELVNRTVVSESPLRVEYELTDAGSDLERVFDEFAAWGNDHLETVTPTVLVAEGDRRLTDLYSGWLADDYDVVRAHSGPDVVPHLDGDVDVLVFAEGLANTDPARVADATAPGCRTILLLDERPDFDVCDIECDGFLRKPVVRETLLDAVDAQLARRGESTEQRELGALTAKRSLLESEYTGDALAGEEAYTELTARIETLEERLEE